MSSLFDELEGRLAQDPRLLRRGGPRVDLSVMLFNARGDARELWLAAEEAIVTDRGASPRLAAAVEALRPVFGERAGRS